MENTKANREIKDRLYKLFLQYPILDIREVLAELEQIVKEVKKQNKEVKNDRAKQ